MATISAWKTGEKCRSYEGVWVVLFILVLFLCCYKRIVKPHAHPLIKNIEDVSFSSNSRETELRKHW